MFLDKKLTVHSLRKRTNLRMFGLFSTSKQSREPAEANKRKFAFNKLEDLNFGGATSISTMWIPFIMVNGNFNYSTLSSDYNGGALMASVD